MRRCGLAFAALLFGCTAGSCSDGAGSTRGSDASGGQEGASAGQDSGDQTGLRISEVMYHPVLEDAFEDEHEFVEIHHRGADPIELGAWRLGCGIEFRFAAGTTLDPGETWVIARNPQALKDAYPELDPAHTLGPYDGDLGNGGDVVCLEDPDGRVVDRVQYTDRFPWPLAADALGAGADWLSPSLLPLSDHRYRGHSLERLDFDGPGDRVEAWMLSELDAATPGRVLEERSAPPVVVERQFLNLDGECAFELSLRVVSRANRSDAFVLEWFVDDPERDDETVREIAWSGSEFRERVECERGAERVVRYRVVGAEDGRSISPRPSAPRAWHLGVVGTQPSPGGPVHELYLGGADWGSLWTAIQDGRVEDCEPRDAWSTEIPAVFVHADQAHEVRVRYQGSRWNRTSGKELAAWDFAGPEFPDPPLALSFRVAFPRYARFDGRKVLLLQKLNQGCPGFRTAVGFDAFRERDIPAPRARPVELWINGGYFHYALDVERIDAIMLEAWSDAMAAKYPERPRPQLGHLFKSSGCNCDEGPFGWGDARPLLEHCGHSPSLRYATTYPRKTHPWAGHDELIAMIDGIAEAHAAGPEELRAFVDEHFALDELLEYLAVMNWTAPRDDMFQNHFLYQRREDARWTILPWDLEMNFDPRHARSSLFVGRHDDPDNRGKWSNAIKDAVLTTHAEEFLARLSALNESSLHPDAMIARLDAYAEDFDRERAEAAPAGLACDFEAEYESFVEFVRERHAHVASLSEGGRAR